MLQVSDKMTDPSLITISLKQHISTTFLHQVNETVVHCYIDFLLGGISINILKLEVILSASGCVGFIGL